MDWASVAIIVGCGVGGGFINALMGGGERYAITLPSKAGRRVELGFWGPIVIGLGASAAAWGLIFGEDSYRAQIGGCLLAAVSGANFFTSQLKLRNLRAATQNAAAATGELGKAFSGSTENGGETPQREADAEDHAEAEEDG